MKVKTTTPGKKEVFDVSHDSPLRPGKTTLAKDQEQPTAEDVFKRWKKEAKSETADWKGRMKKAKTGQPKTEKVSTIEIARRRKEMRRICNQYGEGSSECVAAKARIRRTISPGN